MAEKKPYEPPRILSQDSKVKPEEVGELLEETIAIQKPHELQALADAAASTFERAGHCARTFMPDDNLERAALVAWLRCLQNYSWRQVAGHLNLRWLSTQDEETREQIQKQYGWAPPTNQLFGMAFCDRAAELLGEDSQEPPWN